MTLSIVIPTYGRDEVLTDSIGMLLALEAPADEILVVDQTAEHSPEAAARLRDWHDRGAIRWLRHFPPGTVGAMNRGLIEAGGDVVLFLDDDIIPGDDLIAAHRRAHEECPGAWAVVGQVLQPEDWEGREPTNDTNGHELKLQQQVVSGESEGGVSVVSFQDCVRVNSCDSRAQSLTRDLDFAFNGDTPSWVTNVIGCNLSVKRERALAIGGFDANFTVPVAYRFETEFAKRIVACGGCIRFEPRASIRHLRASRGGTRSGGSHLTSISPEHGVGDYYYALRCGRGWERLRYMAKRPFREVRTKFHLKHPWWIPVKFIGEVRALLLALRLYRRGPRFLPTNHTN